MSQNNDKIKNDDNSDAVNMVPSSENDNMTNKTNTEPTHPELDKQNVPNSLVKPHEPSIRENMVSKATDFLISKQIQNTPVKKKVDFLRMKGLTAEEVQESFLRAAGILNQNKSLYLHNSDPSSQPQPQQIYYNPPNGIVHMPPEPHSWFRMLFGPIAIAATVLYVGYQLYKKYIKCWLFGVQKSTVEKRLEVVEYSIHRCIVLLEERNSHETTNAKDNTNKQNELDHIRAELKSIKSLLLNRSQFPPAPTTSSIPQWQLIKNTKLQAGQKRKNSDSDVQNSSHSSLVNGTSVVPLHDLFDNGAIVGGIEIKTSTLNDLASNESTASFIFDQSTCNDVVAEDKNNSS